MQIDFSTTISLDKDVELRRYPQGYLVCAFDTSQAFSVNRIGALLFDNLDSPVAVGALLDMVSNHFNESLDAIQDDLVSFLSECIELNILRVS